nr:MAG TPA: hypothetical protein [Caudoviricetes sp.]
MSAPTYRRAHVGISWTRPASVPSGAGTRPHARARPSGHMSGSAGRVRRPPLPITGTCPHVRARVQAGTCRDQLDAPGVRPFR